MTDRMKSSIIGLGMMLFGATFSYIVTATIDTTQLNQRITVIENTVHPLTGRTTTLEIKAAGTNVTLSHLAIAVKELSTNTRRLTETMIDIAVLKQDVETIKESLGK